MCITLSKTLTRNILTPKKSGRLIDKYHALSMHYFFVLNSHNKKRELKEHNDKSPKLAIILISKKTNYFTNLKAKIFEHIVPPIRDDIEIEKYMIHS